eukprot:XP_011676520.1 PREDICTED: adipolin [Strongylocentrotus purpuratus]
MALFFLEQTDDPPRKVDPEGSWLSFVRHSSRTSGSSTSTSTSTSSKKKCEKKNKDKSRNSRRLPEADGPAGPPGPQGPAGPAGAQITKQELLTEFRELIREAAERRAQIIIGEKCPSCLLNITEGTELHLPNLEELELLPTLPIAFHCKLSRDLDIPGKSLIEVVNFRTVKAAERRAQIIIGEKCPSCLLNITEGTELHLPNLEELELLPTLPIAFHCKLSRDLDIPGKSLIEVVNFRTPMDTGSFRRGRGLDVRSGRFTAPRTAIYQLSANLHIGQRLSDVKSRELKPRDNVRLLICINSMCQRHTSLEFVSGMESNSRVFTVAVSGLLRLEEGQYASVYIDNSSGRRIEIQVGSDYSGVLMGV